MYHFDTSELPASLSRRPVGRNTILDVLVSLPRISPVNDIQTDLPAIVKDLTLQMYENFEFFAPPMDFVEHHLNEIRRGNY
jgi:hypothetical protein